MQQEMTLRGTEGLLSFFFSNVSLSCFLKNTGKYVSSLEKQFQKIY